MFTVTLADMRTIYNMPLNIPQLYIRLVSIYNSNNYYILHYNKSISQTADSLFYFSYYTFSGSLPATT